MNKKNWLVVLFIIIYAMSSFASAIEVPKTYLENQVTISEISEEKPMVETDEHPEEGEEVPVEKEEEAVEILTPDLMNTQSSLYIKDNIIRTEDVGEYVKFDNEIVEISVASDGKYTIGTKGGNPSTPDDDNQKLTYGHPGGKTSNTVIKVDDSEFIFIANDVSLDEANNRCVATGIINGLEIKQTISIVYNPFTQRDDTIEIKYEVKNISSSAIEVGSRIMIDTMLGLNDGAPFKVDGIGDVTTEIELMGSDIPNYWNAFDSLESPNVISTGTFYKDYSMRPDKVQFVHWPNIVEAPYTYEVADGASLTSDSAVAIYYNPISVLPNQSRNFVTYYGISEFEQDTIDGDIQLTLNAPNRLIVNDQGDGYKDNPFLITLYAHNGTNQIIEDLTMSIDLDESLVLGSSSRRIQHVSNITPNQEGYFSWLVYAKKSISTSDYHFRISSSTDSSLSVEGFIEVPGLSIDEVRKIKISPSYSTVDIGEKAKLESEINDVRPAKNNELSWKSSNNDIVSVDRNGNFEAKNVGSVYLYAKSGNGIISNYARVSVVARETQLIDYWMASEISYAKFKSYHENHKINDLPKDLFRDFKFITEISKKEAIEDTIGNFKLIESENTSNSMDAILLEDLNNNLIIAYKGSKETRDWTDDVVFGAFDHIPEQFYEALLYYNQVRDKYPNRKITLTGHSLGGALASYVSIMTGEEAYGFNSPTGLIIDLAYYCNAKYIKNFDGIENWNFKNYYNEIDLIGDRNYDIYKTYKIEHPSYINFLGIKPHSLETLVRYKNGELQIADKSFNVHYSFGIWSKKKISSIPRNYDALNTLGFDVDNLFYSSGVTYLMQNNIGEFLNIGKNYRGRIVVFGGENSTITGRKAIFGTHYFLADSGTDRVYGDNNADHYYVSNKNKKAIIDDRAGSDKVYFEDLDLSELKITKEGKNYVVRNTKGSGKITINAKRAFLAFKLKLVDKDGDSIKLKNSVLTSGAVQVGLASADEAADSYVKVDAIGSNIIVKLYDTDMNVLYDSSLVPEQQVVEEDYRIIFEEDNHSVSIDAMGTVRYVELLSDTEIDVVGDMVSPLVEAPPMVSTGKIDILAEESVLLDIDFTILEDFAKHVKGEEKVSIPLTSYGDATGIDVVVDTNELFTGEIATIDYILSPEHVVVDFVEVSSSSTDLSVLSHEDGKIKVTSSQPGDVTITLLTLDGTEIEKTINLTFNQKEAPEIFMANADGIYLENNWSKSEVELTHADIEGYTSRRWYVDGEPVSDTSSLVINQDGQHEVGLVLLNPITNGKSAMAVATVWIDQNAPIIEGIIDGQSYFTPRFVKTLDKHLESASINLEHKDVFEMQMGTWITEPGRYEVNVVDASNQQSTLVFEMLPMPTIAELTPGHADLVDAIFEEYEDNKHLFTQAIIEEIEPIVYGLKRRMEALNFAWSDANDILEYNIPDQLFSTIDLEEKTVRVIVKAGTNVNDVLPSMRLSQGASSTPDSWTPVNLSSPLIYTITAGDESIAEWTVEVIEEDDYTGPVLIEYTSGIVSNLVFDDQINNVDTNKIEVFDHRYNKVNGLLFEATTIEKLVMLEIKNAKDVLPNGIYTIKLNEGAVINPSQAKSSNIEFNLTISDSDVQMCSITLDVDQGTFINIESGDYIPGQVIEFTMVPQSNYIFDTWICDKENVINDLTSVSTFLTVPTENIKISAKLIQSTPNNPDNNSESIPENNSAINSISIIGNEIELYIGGSEDEAKDILEVILVGIEEDDIQWTSSDESIVRVVDGEISAVDAGEAVIKASYGEYNDEIKVVVYKILTEEKSPLGLVEFYEPYINGYPDKTFKPGRSVTRAEVATMFSKILKLNLENSGSQIFGDVYSDEWYFKYIQAVQRTGLFVGDDKGNFRPNDPMTRAEIAAVFSNFWEYMNVEVKSDPRLIKDVSDDHWALKHIYKIYNAGLVKGFEDGTFRPDSSVLREQVVVMINTLISRPAVISPEFIFNDVGPEHWAIGSIESASRIFNKENNIQTEE